MQIFRDRTRQNKQPSKPRTKAFFHPSIPTRKIFHPIPMSVMLVFTLFFLVISPSPYVASTSTTTFSQKPQQPSPVSLQAISSPNLLNADQFQLNISTYLGGSSSDQGNGIAVDTNGNSYITGTTSSSNFPLKNAYQSTLGDNLNGYEFV